MQQGRSPRFQVSGLTIVYDTGEEYWTGPVFNVSDSGLFIETAHDELPIGKRIILMPEGIDDTRLPFEIHGEVVRVNELDWDRHWDRMPGIAVRFLDLSDEQKKELSEFLTQYGSVPSWR